VCISSLLSGILILVQDDQMYWMWREGGFQIGMPQL
jgi:hypothetical protein